MTEHAKQQYVNHYKYKRNRVFLRGPGKTFKFKLCPKLSRKKKRRWAGGRLGFSISWGLQELETLNWMLSECLPCGLPILPRLMTVSPSHRELLQTVWLRSHGYWQVDVWRKTAKQGQVKGEEWERRPKVPPWVVLKVWCLDSWGFPRPSQRSKLFWG